jgi:two-component system CheB/CheR fusion protein
MDPPFTKLDILICRNLLIYLSLDVQKKLTPLFHYCLNPCGILFLGSAETIGGCTDLFATLDGKSRLYARTGSGTRDEPVEFPSSFNMRPLAIGDYKATPSALLSLQAAADQLILNRYAPASVFVSDKGDILYISGHTGKYLEPAAGKANWNIFVMAREGLRYELSGAFQKVCEHGGENVLHGLKVDTQGGSQSVDVTLRRLDEPGALHGLVMIVFTDVPTPIAARPVRGHAKARTSSARVVELERELLQIRAEARSAIEETQSAHEELRSANEELQSTNEELQSSNEELTTSKEEMQSLNEELQTVNNELQIKVDELSRASNDMKNLLNSTDIATLFLDNDLNVRRFTPQATKIMRLIPGDVGRPVTDLASELRYPDLAADAREVLRTLASSEKPVGTRDSRWFTVRIMPYRTFDDRIDGVVITFVDITTAKKLEAQLRAGKADLEQQVADSQEPAQRRGKPSSRPAP